MFNTVGEAVEFIREYGKINISPADKNVFHIALAIQRAHTKGQYEGADKILTLLLQKRPGMEEFIDLLTEKLNDIDENLKTL